MWASVLEMDTATEKGWKCFIQSAHSLPVRVISAADGLGLT